MELTVIAALVVAALVSLIGASFVVGFLVATLYDLYSRDGSERRGDGRRFHPWLRNARPFRWLKALLAYELKKYETPPPAGPVLYACRPHGMLAVSAWLTFLDGTMDRRLGNPRATDTRPVLLAVHSVLFSLPLVRDLALALGCIDVSRESIEAALAHGYSVAVLPGGVREMGAPLAALPQSELPGVVKVAWDYDMPLVPVYFGGEAQLCWVWKNEPRVVKWLRAQSFRWTRLFFPLPFCVRFWCLPALRTVMGAALRPSECAGSANELGTALREAENRLKKQAGDCD
jgi:hypothetical protein